MESTNMEMTKLSQRLKNCRVPESFETGDEARLSPTPACSLRRGKSLKSSTLMSSYKFGLYALLFISLIILSSIDVSEGRKAGGRKSRRKQQSENDIQVDQPTGRASRRGQRKGTKEQQRILKTSEEARVITESRYLKKDWCNIKPLKHVVKTRSGCVGTFINNFCYGQCNSFYIPREVNVDGEEQEAFKSCAFCKPFKVQKVSVTLKCPGKRRRHSRTMKRMVNKIMECRCISVPGIDSQTPTPEEVPATSASSATTSGESRR